MIIFQIKEYLIFSQTVLWQCLQQPENLSTIVEWLSLWGQQTGLLLQAADMQIIDDRYPGQDLLLQLLVIVWMMIHLKTFLGFCSVELLHPLTLPLNSLYADKQRRLRCDFSVLAVQNNHRQTQESLWSLRWSIPHICMQVCVNRY